MQYRAGDHKSFTKALGEEGEERGERSTVHMEDSEDVLYGILICTFDDWSSEYWGVHHNNVK